MAVRVRLVRLVKPCIRHALAARLSSAEHPADRNPYEIMKRSVETSDEIKSSLTNQSRTPFLDLQSHWSCRAVDSALSYPESSMQP